MYGSSYFADQEREYRRIATRKGTKPLVFFAPVTLETVAASPIPVSSLDYSREGWRRVDDLLVDSTGSDNRGPALSQAAFIAWINAHIGLDYGYVVSEAGQFQVNVTVWQTPAGRTLRRK